MLNLLCGEEAQDPVEHCDAPWTAQANQQEPVVYTGSESSLVGEVEILRDEKSSSGLRSRPDVRVFSTDELL